MNNKGTGFSLDKKFNYTYKTTNLINGKFYYGCHSSDNPFSDNYIGSGIYLKNSINIYGKENFKIELLNNFNTRAEMLIEESKIVTQKEVDDPMCYNLKGGGRGSVILSKETRYKLGSSNRGKTKETHQRLASRKKGKTKFDDESVMKISIALTGRNKVNTPYIADMADKLKGRTKETHDSNASQSEKMKGRTKKTHEYITRIAIKESIGIYFTPYGNFYSLTDASKKLNVNIRTIKNWCRVKNKNIILFSPTISHYLKQIHDVFNKTYKEAGFYFIKFPKDCIDFNKKIKFAIENNVDVYKN